jgi:hypothetical protein
MTMIIHDICGLMCWISLMTTIVIYEWIHCKYGDGGEK